MKPDLAKLLFPRLPPDLQRRKLRVMFVALFTGLLVAGIVALVMFEADNPKLF
jgi:hypothetical protein